MHLPLLRIFPLPIDATDVLSTLFAGRAATDPEKVCSEVVKNLGGGGIRF